MSSQAFGEMWLFTSVTCPVCVRPSMQSVSQFCLEFSSCSLRRNVHPTSRINSAVYTNGICIVAFCVNVWRNLSEKFSMIELSWKVWVFLLRVMAVSYSIDGNFWTFHR